MTGEREKKEVPSEFVVKELEIIQNIIDRMVSNSFMTKGWAITLVVATFLLEGVTVQVLIAFIPLLVFWVLDAYFLRTERMYRELYRWVIKKRPASDEKLFDMDASRFKDDVQSWARTMISSTLLLFYGSVAFLLGIYIGIALLQNLTGSG